MPSFRRLVCLVFVPTRNTQVGSLVPCFCQLSFSNCEEKRPLEVWVDSTSRPPTQIQERLSRLVNILSRKSVNWFWPSWLQRDRHKMCYDRIRATPFRPYTCMTFLVFQVYEGCSCHHWRCMQVVAGFWVILRRPNPEMEQQGLAGKRPFFVDRLIHKLGVHPCRSHEFPALKQTDLVRPQPRPPI